MSKKDIGEVKFVAHGYGRPLTPEEKTALGEAAIRSDYFSNHASEAIKMDLTDEQVQNIRQNLSPNQQLIFDKIQEYHINYKNLRQPAYELTAAIGLEGLFNGRSNPDIFTVLQTIINKKSEQ